MKIKSLSLNQLNELFDKCNIDKNAPITIMGASINYIWENSDGSITLDESPCEDNTNCLPIKY